MKGEAMLEVKEIHCGYDQGYNHRCDHYKHGAVL